MLRGVSSLASGAITGYYEPTHAFLSWCMECEWQQEQADDFTEELALRSRDKHNINVHGGLLNRMDGEPEY